MEHTSRDKRGHKDVAEIPIAHHVRSVAVGSRRSDSGPTKLDLREVAAHSGCTSIEVDIIPMHCTDHH